MASGPSNEGGHSSSTVALCYLWEEIYWSLSVNPFSFTNGAYSHPVTICKDRIRPFVESHLDNIRGTWNKSVASFSPTRGSLASASAEKLFREQVAMVRDSSPLHFEGKDIHLIPVSRKDHESITDLSVEQLCYQGKEYKVWTELLADDKPGAWGGRVRIGIEEYINPSDVASNIVKEEGADSQKFATAR